jgi:hypothetical protein
MYIMGVVMGIGSIIVEVKKFHHLPSVSQRTKEASGGIQPETKSLTNRGADGVTVSPRGALLG